MDTCRATIMAWLWFITMILIIILIASCKGGNTAMRGGNCQTCKHFLKVDQYPGGHYIGICQGERLGVKVDGLSICEGFQLDSDKRNALRRAYPDEAGEITFIFHN